MRIFFLAIIIIAAGYRAAADVPVPLWKEALPVCEASGEVDQQNPQIINDSEGNQVIIFEDKRSGQTNLYAERIDGGGSLLWGKGGVLLCEAPGNQTAAQAVACPDGSIIVAWEDDRDNNFDIYAQKIDLTGRRIWSPNGKAIAQGENSQRFPQLTGDGLGGAIISWNDIRANNEDICAQRIGGRGNILWAENGLAVTSLPGTQWFAKIASDRQNGAVIVWADRREKNFDIYAQRISPSGAMFWPANGSIVANTDLPEEDPAVISLADGNTAISYRIKNNGIYFQVLDPAGRRRLGNQGKKISLRSLSPTAPQINAGKQNETIIVWSDSYAGDPDIYSQLIDESGNLLWGAEEYPIAKTTGAQEKPRVAGNSPWVISWIDGRSGLGEIYAQKIDRGGGAIWAAKRISEGQKDPRTFDLTVTEDGKAIFCWEDQRSGSSDIFAQTIDGFGNALRGDAGILVNAARGLSAQRNFQIVNDGTDNFVFALEDLRSGVSNIYLQKISPGGKKLWSPSGISAGAYPSTQKNPRLMSDSSGGVMVVWEDHRGTAGVKLFSQRINSKGEKIWKKSGVALTDPHGYSEQTNSKIISDKKNGAIIVFEEFQGHYNGKDIKAQRLGPDGKLLWGGKGTIIATGGGDQSEPQISQKTFTVVWTDNRVDGKHSDIYAQRLSLSGKPLWQDDGVPVCEAPDVQMEPFVLDLNQETFVSWTDRGGGSFDIYSQKLGPNGNFEWIKDGLAVCQSAHTQQRAKISPSGQNELLLIWEDFRFGNWDIFGQRLNSQGQLLSPEDGLSIVASPGTQYNPDSIKIGNYNLIAWEDFRSGENYSIYLQKLDAGGRSVYPTDGWLVESSLRGGRMPRLSADKKGNSFLAAWEDLRFGEPVIFCQRFTP